MANGRLMKVESIVILLTCIKRLSVLKNNFGLFLSGRLRQVLLYLVVFQISRQKFQIQGTKKSAKKNIAIL